MYNLSLKILINFWIFWCFLEFSSKFTFFKIIFWNGLLHPKNSCEFLYVMFPLEKYKTILYLDLNWYLRKLSHLFCFISFKNIEFVCTKNIKKHRIILQVSLLTQYFSLTSLMKNRTTTCTCDRKLFTVNIMNNGWYIIFNW